MGLTLGRGGAYGTQTKQELRTSWTEKDGEHAWLEEVESEAALKWVVEQNESAVAALGDPNATALYGRVLSILDSKEKIPSCDSASTPPPQGVLYCRVIDGQPAAVPHTAAFLEHSSLCSGRTR